MDSESIGCPNTILVLNECCDANFSGLFSGHFTIPDELPAFDRD